MKEIQITDFKNIKVGNYTDEVNATGVTVAVFNKGATAGVSVIGGAPGTRETDLLRPENLVDKVHSVFLTGGSAFGLNVAGGIMKYLEEKKIGFDTIAGKIPIVTGAVLYDLEVGNNKVKPDSKMGYLACENSEESNYENGNFGAGTGCSVAKILGVTNSKKAGIGYYGVEIDGLKVGAIVALNAFGSIYENNKIIKGPSNNLSTEDIIIDSKLESTNALAQNTTIAMVFTNAEFDKAKLTKISNMAHDGFSRTIKPTHTFYDGDTIFAVSLDTFKADPNRVGVISQYVVEKAVLVAAKSSKQAYGLDI